MRSHHLAIEFGSRLFTGNIRLGRDGMIDVSVVIVNWNAAALLAQCLNSLEQGCKRFQAEVFVVDNGSTDGSAEMVAEKFPRVQLIRNDSNRGFAAANNLALGQATGRYFLLLNSDTVVCPGALDSMIAYADQHSGVGLVGPELLNQDGSRQGSFPQPPTVLAELVNRSLLRKLFPGRYYGKSFRPTEPTAVHSLVGACLLIRASLVKQIGLLDEDYFFYCEEIDWCVRARTAGAKVVYFPDAKVHHLGGGSSGDSGMLIPREIEYWRSRYTLMRKHYSFAGRTVMRVAMGIKLPVKWISAGVAGLFSGKSRRKRRVLGAVIRWHLAGCPASWGLRGTAKQQRQ